VEEPVRELTGVIDSGGELEDPVVAFDHIVHPLPLVPVSVDELHLSLPLFFPELESASVLVTVLVDVNPLSVHKIIFPVSFVEVAFPHHFSMSLFFVLFPVAVVD